MKQSLAIRTPEGEIVARLTWSGGKATGQSLTPLLDADVARWVRDGLDEWVGEGVDAEPRSTPSSSPEFLNRLEAYLCRQFEEYVIERREEDDDAATLEPLVEFCQSAPSLSPHSIEFVNAYTMALRGVRTSLSIESWPVQVSMGTAGVLVPPNAYLGEAIQSRMRQNVVVRGVSSEPSARGTHKNMRGGPPAVRLEFNVGPAVATVESYVNGYKPRVLTFKPIGPEASLEDRTRAAHG